MLCMYFLPFFCDCNIKYIGDLLMKAYIVYLTQYNIDYYLYNYCVCKNKYENISKENIYKL